MEVVQDLSSIDVKRTLVYDEETDQHFLVSSVEDPYETLIFTADEHGGIKSYTDVWGTGSVSHEEVIELLVVGRLTTEYFYNMEEN